MGLGSSVSSIKRRLVLTIISNSFLSDTATFERISIVFSEGDSVSISTGFIESLVKNLLNVIVVSFFYRRIITSSVTFSISKAENRTIAINVFIEILMLSNEAIRESALSLITIKVLPFISAAFSKTD